MMKDVLDTVGSLRAYGLLQRKVWPRKNAGLAQNSVSLMYWLTGFDISSSGWPE